MAVPYRVETIHTSSGLPRESWDFYCSPARRKLRIAFLNCTERCPIVSELKVGYTVSLSMLVAREYIHGQESRGPCCTSRYHINEKVNFRKIRYFKNPSPALILPFVFDPAMRNNAPFYYSTASVDNRVGVVGKVAVASSRTFVFPNLTVFGCIGAIYVKRKGAHFSTQTQDDISYLSTTALQRQTPPWLG